MEPYSSDDIKRKKKKFHQKEERYDFLLKKGREMRYDKRIFLRGNEEYLKFCGITSKERTPLYYSNKNLKYLLELTNNLDFIATNMLRGILDKMLLVGKGNIKEKCQFYENDNIIYVVYGVFPNKKGKWILEQMAKSYGELILNKDVDNLISKEKNEIDIKFDKALRCIFREYPQQLTELFNDQEIPYVDDSLRIDYLGLSSMSIGVISLLLDEEGNLSVEVLGEFDNPAEEKEMKESLLTTKIEAIAANTLGNTGAYPRWIAVKLGFQQYRFLTFKKYQNDYFLSLLSEGNLKKVKILEDKLTSLLYHAIDKPFAGNLKPFNQLKSTLKEKLRIESKNLIVLDRNFK